MCCPFSCSKLKRCKYITNLLYYKIINYKMNKIKEYGNIAIEEIKKWYFINWNDGLYNRGKTIFVSIVAFFILIKIIYSIFA